MMDKHDMRSIWFCIRFLTVIAILMCTGCAHMDVKQLAFEMLSAEDCRRNQLDEFCARTYASEYLEYERIRRDFLRNQNQNVWRAKRDANTLPGLSG